MGRGRLVGAGVAVVGALCALAALTGAGTPSAGPSTPEPAAGGGAVTAVGGRLLVSGDSGRAYLDLHNAGPDQVLVQAAVSPAAASVLWTTRQQVLTPGHLFTASALCEDGTSARSRAAANALARSLHDLVVNPGQTLRLAPGSGSFELTGVQGHLPAGARVPLTLYLTNGQQLTTDLLVNA